MADAARRTPRAPAQRSARRSTPPPRGQVLLRAVSGDPPLEAYVYLPRTLAPQARVIERSLGEKALSLAVEAYKEEIEEKVREF